MRIFSPEAAALQPREHGGRQARPPSSINARVRRNLPVGRRLPRAKLQPVWPSGFRNRKSVR
eukprot:13181641-Alexandrium_andersonii.AAC.1